MGIMSREPGGMIETGSVGASLSMNSVSLAAEMSSRHVARLLPALASIVKTCLTGAPDKDTGPAYASIKLEK